MAWIAPQYSKSVVDKSGKIIIAPLDSLNIGEYLEALDVVNNWRSAHNFPLNTFQVGLRKRGRGVDPDCIVAQRIKRLSSIRLKLERFDGLRMSQIQDIAGCRAVVRNVANVYSLLEVYNNSDLKHKLAVFDDYLENPKPSGYRGVHLIYKYFSDKNPAYNDLRIELQIRSQFQHAWATAVETVGTFVGQALKSSAGEGDWLRLFELMGSAIAIQEACRTVPNTPTTPRELRSELTHYARKLNVTSRLQAYGDTLNFFLTGPSSKDHAYFLLKLDAKHGRTEIRAFTRPQLKDAQDTYLAMEEETRGDESTDVVLVSVDSISSLQKAYPNYFLDTRVFIGLLSDAIAGRSLAIAQGSLF